MSEPAKRTALATVAASTESDTMRIALNIGLQTSGRVGVSKLLGIDTVKQFVREAGFKIESLKVEQSVSEPTAVMVVESAEVWRFKSERTSIYDLSKALEQDCIAAAPIVDGRLLLGHGRLIGPHWMAWGAFQPEFFLAPEVN